MPAVDNDPLSKGRTEAPGPSAASGTYVIDRLRARTMKTGWAAEAANDPLSKGRMEAPGPLAALGTYANHRLRARKMKTGWVAAAVMEPPRSKDPSEGQDPAAAAGT